MTQSYGIWYYYRSEDVEKSSWWIAVVICIIFSKPFLIWVSGRPDCLYGSVGTKLFQTCSWALRVGWGVQWTCLQGQFRECCKGQNNFRGGETESDTELSRSTKSWVIRRRSHVSSYVTTKRHQVKLSESSFRQAQGSQVSTIKPWNYLPSDTVDGKVLQEFKKSSEIHRRKIDEGLGSIDSPALLQEIPD